MKIQSASRILALVVMGSIAVRAFQQKTGPASTSAKQTASTSIMMFAEMIHSIIIAIVLPIVLLVAKV
ncbi:MAG: hypothetical protein M0Z77_05655 [Thermoplasmatales archaeon]|nr:hypothetical protein [Thermoplasmatales archaeon]